MKKSTLAIIGILLVLCVYGCSSYNGLVEKDQAVKTKWANVQTQYQRRADLIPNLVNTVKGAANFEKSTLTEVINARSRATSIQLNASDLTPENIQKFQAAQDQLKGSLDRLLVTVEKYPELKANQNFLELQSQIEGTENRIGVARNEFNGSVEVYNTSALRFPTVIFAKIFGFSEKGRFEASQSAQSAPAVQF
ncbi:LemA family protein [Emticicia sp. 17c]|uniref:LemA family protein n=1 Tax=Emticicia sp. 17c TaxID=3127704 RepID=UPI00301E190A